MVSVRFAAFAVAALIAPFAQQPAQRPLAIAHASLIDVTDGTVVPDVTVTIAGELTFQRT
jgi:hypothetical protein